MMLLFDQVIKLKILILSLGLFFVTSSAYATIRNCADCEEATIQTEIDASIDGDTVKLPASSACDWTSDVTIAGKGITLDFNGCTITNKSSGTDGVLEIDPDNDTYIRITNGTMSGDSANSGSTRHLDIVGDPSDAMVIVDNMIFNTGYISKVWEIAAVIRFSGTYGLVYDCTFTDAAKEVIGVIGDVAHWSADDLDGTVNNVIIEDCTIENVTCKTVGAAHAVMGSGSARYTLRYTIIRNYNIDAHGFCGNTGTRWYEIYQNSCEVNPGFSQADWMFIRGGTGVIYNNTMNVGGKLNNDIRLTEYRVDQDYCGAMTYSCCCEASDGEDTGTTGYPCWYQIGRGNAQALSPLYIYSNSVNDSPAEIIVYDFGDPPSVYPCNDECGGSQNMSDYIVEDRDYYLSSKGGYTAYTYPHPLQGEGTCAVTGTLDGTSESNILGKTIILTLTGDTWPTDIDEDSTNATALIGGITGSLSGAGTWDNEVTIEWDDITQDSDTQITITLSDIGSYNINQNEEISVVIPDTVCLGEVEIIGEPTAIIVSYESEGGTAGRTGTYDATGYDITYDSTGHPVTME